MRLGASHWTISVLVSSVAYAKADSTVYNASLPFRPANVTGLYGLYDWVGSYYNATAKVELTPQYGYNISTPVCENLRGTTWSLEYDALLAVAERGPFNEGNNSVNTYLTLWHAGTNLSSETWTEVHDIWDSPTLEWFLESSPWTYQSDNVTMNDLHEDAPYQDVFNWTLAPTKQAPYSLTGILPNTTLADTDMVVSMDSCNSSIETKDWLAWIIVMPWDETAGWNWTQPTVGLQFDSRTANFTLDGYFLAQPFIKENSTYQYLDEGNIRLASAKGPDVTMGKISIKFEGVIDSYHSDVLVNNSATPTWLKSVGFGNNSMNIGNGSTLSAGPRQSWVVAVFVVLFASMLMYI